MKDSVTKERRDGQYLLLLGTLVFLLLGAVLETSAPAPMSDFKAIYYAARSVIHHSDPYLHDAILREFQAGNDEFPTNPVISQSVQRAILVCINLPTSLFLMVPFALLGYGTSHLLWMMLMAGSLLLAAYLIWSLGAEFNPIVSGALVGLVLANSEVLVIIGNAAAVVIGFGLIAVWCFVKDRFSLFGVVLLAVALVLKPHDVGFIWLYLLLAGGILRKRALQSFVLVIAISLPAILWISHVAPHWVHELHLNLSEVSARGDLNDPGPSSMGAHTLGMAVNLQTVTSIFRDDPNFYNPVTYLIIGPLILIWSVVTLRSRYPVQGMWLALASISALSLLPVYHRIYDAKILLLSIPACAMLWAEGGLTGKFAAGITSLAILLTSDLPWVIFSLAFNHLVPVIPELPFRLVNGLIVFPTPTILLAMGIFYLWVYIRRGDPAPIDPSPPQKKV